MKWLRDRRVSRVLKRGAPLIMVNDNGANMQAGQFRRSILSAICRESWDSGRKIPVLPQGKGIAVSRWGHTVATHFESAVRLRKKYCALIAALTQQKIW